MKKQDLLQLDVHPFTRLVWNSEGARARYETTISEAMSLHDRAEYEMVRLGERKCGTLHLYPHSFDDTIEQVQKDGMVWLPIQWSGNYSGFSHYHVPTTPGDPNSSCYGVIARNLDDAEMFRTASAYNGRNAGKVDHEVIGELLGFPPCCTKFFVDEWGRGFFDPMWQSAVAAKNAAVTDRQADVEGHVHTNQMLRYNGLRTVSHFPCSLDCQESIKVGEVWLDVMQKINPDATAYLVELLEMPLIWTCLHGIAIVETPIFTIITNSMPTKERWTVMYNAPGKDKPADVLLPLGTDVDYEELTKVMVEQLQWRA